MMKPRTFSLQFKIISVFILAIVLPALLFSVVLTSISRKSIQASIFYQQQATVQRIADRINAQIDRHVKLLFAYEDIGKLPRSKQLDAGRDILMQGNAFSEVMLLNAAGYEQWKFSRAGVSKTLVNHSRRREYQRALTGQLFISQIYFSSEHQPYIVIAAPLSGRSGALVAKLDFGQMWQWISEVKIGETGIAFVVDRKGNLIAHPETERVLAHSNFSDLPIVRDYLDNVAPVPGRWREYRDERGEKVVALFEPLKRMGWAVVTQIPSKEVYAPVRAMHQRILLWTLFWTIVFLFVGSRLVRHIIHPLSILQKGAQQISQGKLDIALDIRTGDEIEALAHNFEKMAVALKELDQLRQDLTRMIIHDLKSPLSGIMGSLDYLESGLLGDVNDDQKKIVSLAKKSSESMLSMIQNLLDVARMEEGKLELQKEATDLAALVDDRRRQYEPLVKSEGKSIEASVAPDLPPAQIDRHLVERVLNNLLSNAVNHTSSDGRISVRVARRGNAFEFTVADNGAGIPEEYREKIFEKFVQVKRKQAHLRTGAGLGLTFCRMVVEAHGGTIRVESELNKGSSFIFTLPA